MFVNTSILGPSVFRGGGFNANPVFQNGYFRFFSVFQKIPFFHNFSSHFRFFQFLLINFPFFSFKESFFNVFSRKIFFFRIYESRIEYLVVYIVGSG